MQILDTKYRSINQKNTAKILENSEAAFNMLHLLGFVSSSSNSNQLLYTNISTAVLDLNWILMIYIQTQNISDKLFDLACNQLLFKNIRHDLFLMKQIKKNQNKNNNKDEKCGIFILDWKKLKKCNDHQINIIFLTNSTPQQHVQQCRRNCYLRIVFIACHTNSVLFLSTCLLR